MAGNEEDILRHEQHKVCMGKDKYKPKNKFIVDQIISVIFVNFGG